MPSVFNDVICGAQSYPVEVGLSDMFMLTSTLKYFHRNEFVQFNANVYYMYVTQCRLWFAFECDRLLIVNQKTLFAQQKIETYQQLVQYNFTFQ